MRWMILLLCLSPCVQSQTVEYLRPTTDTNTSTSACSTLGTNTASSSMSAAYSGKTGAGPTGSSASLDASYSGGARWAGRQFSTWQTSIYGGYAYLTVNLTVSQLGSSPVSYACYSTNGGSTWTSFGNINVGSTETTFTVAITGTVLSNLLVDLVTVAPFTGPKSTIVYDLWTSGTPGGGFPGIIRSSYKGHDGTVTISWTTPTRR